MAKVGAETDWSFLSCCSKKTFGVKSFLMESLMCLRLLLKKLILLTEATWIAHLCTIAMCDQYVHVPTFFLKFDIESIRSGTSSFYIKNKFMFLFTIVYFDLWKVDISFPRGTRQFYFSSFVPVLKNFSTAQRHKITGK